MSIQLVTPAPVGPVDLTTALRHVRALQSEADLVWLYLQAATQAVEDYTGRALVTQHYRLLLDSWPNTLGYVNSESHPLWLPRNLKALELRRFPLVSIDSVKYYAPGDTTLTTWATSNYQADVNAMPGRLVFLDTGVVLPDLDFRADALQIDFTAGYGVKSSAIPPLLKMAVLTYTHHLYDVRLPVAETRFAPEMPFSLRYMLRAMRVDSLIPLK